MADPEPAQGQVWRASLSEFDGRMPLAAELAFAALQQAANLFRTVSRVEIARELHVVGQTRLLQAHRTANRQLSQ